MGISIDTFLHFSPEQEPHIRVKFNRPSPYEHPLEVYKSSPEKVNTDWLLWHSTRRYFPYVGIIAINLIPLGGDTWLLTTIKEITAFVDVEDDVGYEARELPEYAPLYGRLILKFHKASQQGVMKYDTVRDKLIVHELLPDTFDGDDFPGYDKVRLTYDQLNRIIVNKKRDWIAALENQKAVYLITDTNNGKLYVGSATSAYGMLLARWSAYASNGHGGNVELVKLVEKEGFDYVKKYFTYSILENYNAKVDDYVIRARESWWKETLKTRQFGYNDN